MGGFTPCADWNSAPVAAEVTAPLKRLELKSTVAVNTPVDTLTDSTLLMKVSETIHGRIVARALIGGGYEHPNAVVFAECEPRKGSCGFA
jgi:hypothetical protein